MRNVDGLQIHRGTMTTGAGLSIGNLSKSFGAAQPALAKVAISPAKISPAK